MENTITPAIKSTNKKKDTNNRIRWKRMKESKDQKPQIWRRKT